MSSVAELDAGGADCAVDRQSRAIFSDLSICDIFR